MDKLPLGIRRDLRDAWDSPQSPVKKEIAKLSELLGLEVAIELEVSMIWAELQKYFPDKETFVPTMIGVVKAWVECLITRLEDDANTKWTDNFLEHVNRTGRPALRARTEVQCWTRLKTIPGPRPTTSLGKRKATPSTPEFVIALPESLPPYRNASASFESDFQTMFDEGTLANEDEWTSVTTSLPAKSAYEPASQSHLLETLPSLDSLPRPERLFESQLPYQLIVRLLSSGINNGIVVQSSHQPSLELLAAYLTKYTKSMKGVSSKIPEVKIELQESKYGLGTFFDSLFIINSDSRSLNSSNLIILQNPTVILAFIEGVLGYQLIAQCCNENQWYFRRDVRLSS